MKRLLTVLTLSIVCGCSPTNVNLNSEARNVEVVTLAATSECEFVSLVTCQLGSNFQTYENNVDNCMNVLRNKAAAKGASHLSIEAPQRDTSGSAFSDSDCKNCVNMSGQALNCGG